MRLSAVVVSACLVLLTACSKDSDRHAQASSPGSSAPPAAVTTTAPPTNYQVKRGDTLSSIAKHFGVPVDAIVAANQLPSRDQLTEGQMLVIPPPAAVVLAATPAEAQPGASIQLALTGAQPSETVTFEIASPSGATFTGPPHTAGTNGSVSAKYQTTPQDPPGAYTVSAKGSGPTTAQTTFHLNGPTTTSTATVN
jgi:LysM repeat protein